MKLTWTTKEGQKLTLDQMESSHLENCIRLLKKRINISQIYMEAMLCELSCRDGHKEKLQNIIQSAFDTEESFHLFTDSIDEMDLH